MTEEVRDCYDQLAANYHLIFADWNTSIARQAGVIGAMLEREGIGSPARILDCACGIGTQALGLAERDYKLTGCDISAVAIERARREASQRMLSIQFFVADVRDLNFLPANDFDTVVCLDNSLPHLESDEQLHQAAIEIRKKLRPGGLFLASIRDYDRLAQDRVTVQGPSFFVDSGRRRIVHQVWDWIDERRYTFHLYITREKAAGWECHHYASGYRALFRSELTRTIQSVGFVDTRWMMPAETGFYQPIMIAKTESPTRPAI